MKKVTEPLRTLVWYLARPNLMPELVRQVAKRIKGRELYHAEEALARCEREAISPEQTLQMFSPGYQIEDQHLTLRKHEEEAKHRLASVEGLMGGGGKS